MYCIDDYDYFFFKIRYSSAYLFCASTAARKDSQSSGSYIRFLKEALKSNVYESPLSATDPLKLAPEPSPLLFSGILTAS
ncbi:MAG: hypothetical protein C0594_04760 [Marinilabiliales bacterium]|nr:MAG: hypothetical protein C0594_04760 [Marinilabiliales bacterium]